MTRTRSEQLADALETCRPWSDEIAVAAALAGWADSVPWVDAHGKQTSAPDPADVAEELRFVGRAEPGLDAATVASIAAGMLGNVAANRSATDYASPFVFIRGLPESTSRRYRQPMRRRAVEERRKAALARYFDAEARHRTATTTANRATVAAEADAARTENNEAVEELRRGDGLAGGSLWTGLQQDLDIASLVNDKRYSIVAARAWLRRHPSQHATDAPAPRRPYHGPTEFDRCRAMRQKSPGPDSRG